MRQPDAESSGTAGRGTHSDDAGPLGSRCTVFADVPTVRSGRLVATGRYRCAKANGGVDAFVYLQIDNGGGHWSTVTSKPMGASGVDTTKKRPEKNRTGTAEAVCAPGTYRTFVGGTVSKDEQSFHVETKSDPVTVPCATPSGSASPR